MQIKLFIDKEKLEQKDTGKYLGIYFDKNLTWNKHIECITANWIEGLVCCKKLENLCKKKS